jgi:hypothetical protein
MPDEVSKRRLSFFDPGVEAKRRAVARLTAGRANVNNEMAGPSQPLDLENNVLLHQPP